MSLPAAFNVRRAGGWGRNRVSYFCSRLHLICQLMRISSVTLSGLPGVSRRVLGRSVAPAGRWQAACGQEAQGGNPSGGQAWWKAVAWCVAERCLEGVDPQLLWISAAMAAHHWPKLLQMKLVCFLQDGLFCLQSLSLKLCSKERPRWGGELSHSPWWNLCR